MNRIVTGFLAGAAFGAGATAVPLLAAVNLPHVFSAGETASASEVNANFEALVTAVDNLEADVRDLESQDLDARVHTLEDAEVQRLNAYLEVYDTASDVPSGAETTDARAPIVRVTGANLQIVNGAGVDGQQRPSANGLGNLLVGYTRSRGHFTGGPETCSNGEHFDNVRPFNNDGPCTDNGHTWSLDHHSGSHNVVAGIGAAYSATGGLIAGQANAVNRDNATVSGGKNNIAYGKWSTVSGGNKNLAAGERSSVTGGSENKAFAPASVISAGFQNETSNREWAAVSGGDTNFAEGEASVISGGEGNYISPQGISAVISGGERNDATAEFATVSGARDKDANTSGAHLP